MILFAISQHSGLAENVLDHRLNSRTILMNPLFRFIYSNMNYHIEHHMFPMVPYHALPKLHEELKKDMPEPYPSLYSAFKEIIPTLLKQVKDPWYHVKRELPDTAVPLQVDKLIAEAKSEYRRSEGNWVEVCDVGTIEREDVMRFDHEDKTYAIYRSPDDTYHATEGFCTHGKHHLANGLVMGCQIECPKHNGRFEYKTGKPVRAPVCVALKTYEVEVMEGKVCLNLDATSARDEPANRQTYAYSVTSNDNVATFIKELVLEPIHEPTVLDFTPGDYIHMVIPEYKTTFSNFDIKEPYAKTWEALGLFSCKAINTQPTTRNYSMASHPKEGPTLRFNIRIATPPPGSGYNAGVGSSYVFNLKPGDTVRLMGPFGDFHINDTDREMIYLGGGAGMAPLRSQLSHLFETLNTKRKVSFWYGARSLQEIFYQDYFEDLAKGRDNFSFNVALSEPLEEDEWQGPTGFIHELLESAYLKDHPDPSKVEFYLCGPPPMLVAAREMVDRYGVVEEQIRFDDFT